jgi:sulfur-carrier protein adenylyltransferase/sulfurtransferase
MSTTELVIEPEELSARLLSSEPLILLDVRNGWEHETVHLEGSTLIPLQTLHARVHELDRNREIVVYCHLGARSLMAAQFLQQAGFRARSLEGGIDLWAQLIDPGMQRY